MKLHPALILTMLVLNVLIGPFAFADDDGGVVFTHNERPIAEMETARAEIPPVHVALPKDRLHRLPATVARLAEGPALRVVMLGDSIINDTARSAWHEQVAAQFPKCEITRIVSVRGSTGCWFYKDPEKIERYVISQKPDLVIIGGISHGNDVDSISLCLDAIHNALPKCEFFLMTGPYGEADPLSAENWRKQFRDGKDVQYAADLKELAEKRHAEYFDLQATWGEYIRAAGKPLDYFKRDPVHANARGEAVLGAILTQYFSPVSEK